MQRPWVLFDIDGVLNPFFNDLADFTGFESFQTPFSSWLINRELHGLWLRDLERLADLRWASMWRANSNALNGQYQLRRKVYPHLNWLDWYPETNQTYKLPTIKYEVGKRRPIVWVDDELESDTYAWADERGNTVLIHCDPGKGWTLAEYETIVFFLANRKRFARLRGLHAHRITTRLHGFRELAQRYDLTELRAVQSPQEPEVRQVFEVQFSELTDEARVQLQAELEELLAAPIELVQQANGRKGSIRLW
jgi:hypothetical protein